MRVYTREQPQRILAYHPPSAFIASLPNSEPRSGRYFPERTPYCCRPKQHHLLGKGPQMIPFDLERLGTNSES